MEHGLGDERWIEYEIAELLHRARDTKCVSLSQVAEMINMNLVAIHCWEHGKSWPATLSRLGNWCRAYGLVINLSIRKRGGPVIYSKDL